MIRHVWLGLVQGLTEFLPVSSSAHLLLAQRWLGLREPSALLVGFAHLGTLLAVLIWFRKDLAGLVGGLWRGERGAWRYLGALVLGTLPLLTGAWLARGRLDQVFQVAWTPFTLFVNGLVLVWTGWRFPAKTKRSLTPLRALGIGLAQLLAVLPGLSRSGLTLACGLRLGLSREEAFRFSFLLGIPAILGGVVLASLEGTARVEEWTGVALTAGIAFVSGILALALLFQAVRRRALWPFGLYCLLLAVLILALV